MANINSEYDTFVKCIAWLLAQHVWFTGTGVEHRYFLGLLSQQGFSQTMSDTLRSTLRPKVKKVGVKKGSKGETKGETKEEINGDTNAEPKKETEEALPVVTNDTELDSILSTI